MAKSRSTSYALDGEPRAVLAPLEQRAEVSMHIGENNPRVPRWEILFFGITVPVRFVEVPPSV